MADSGNTEAPLGIDDLRGHRSQRSFVRPGHGSLTSSFTRSPDLATALSQLLIDLGVTRSHSRPKVSNDNPYSEAQFKTTKYMSDYPERFDSLAHAREWFDAFIAYYNHEHRHSGIGWHTPASVHFGTAEEVRDQRAVTLAGAYARHPERFGRRPRPPAIPQTAWINDPAKRREPAPQTS